MKTTSSDLKKRAKLTLSGNYGTAVGAMLIVDVFLIVICMVFIGVSMAGTFSIIGGAGYIRSSMTRSLVMMLVIYFIAILLIIL